ncbi:hypothetical protein [Leptolyngbya ohadii]|uniref:hypothetical protein n=1 Tax=Leptolyngbya ohadii TaxID=1962290 RepID=UPI001179D923|nr:hypothetical protein [Leptolyngbya ohadii]
MNSTQTLSGFTVYQSAGFVTIRSGFSDIPGWRVICSCWSYAQALDAAQSAAHSKRQLLRVSN